MLTISQLADYVGVTVRAVRHYHQRGLLAEPERDASGYRRYGAQAVIDLIRIRTLADAGVPLARIEELLGAEPERFAEAVDRIDRDLADRIRELRRHRRRIAELVAGERLYLPPDMVEYLDRLRAIGLSEETVRLERDGWIMLRTSYPEHAPQWLAQKLAGLADPEFQQIYLAYDRARGWDPDDPRLAQLVDRMVRFFVGTSRPPEELPLLTDLAKQSPDLNAVLESHMLDYAPAWDRVNLLTLERMEQIRREGGS